MLQVKNNAHSTLASDISDTDTSLTLATGGGANFPSTTPFHITIDDEILEVTAVSTDTFTVTRHAEDTTAAAHSAGAKVELNETAGVIQELQTEKLSNVVEDATPQLGGELDAQAHSIGFTEQAITSSSGSATIDWRNGNKAAITLAEDTTFTFTAPTKPCNLVLRLVQDSTGGHSITLPTIKYPGGTAPTFSTDANAIDVLSLYWTGSDYLGQASLNFG